MIDEIDLARATGHLALLLLVATLAASLVRRVKIHRRTIGLLSFFAGLAHAAYVISTPLVEDLSHLYYEPHLRAGVSVLLILLVLAATSFPNVVKIPEWKLLHRLVYVAALLGLHHLALSAHATRSAIILPAAAIAGLLIFRTVRLRTRARSPLAMPGARGEHPPPNTPDRR